MWHQIALNKRRTVYVILFLGVLFLIFGAVFGYFLDGTVDGVILGIEVLFIVYVGMVLYAGNSSVDGYFGDELKKCGKDNPKIYNIVEEMCVASGLPKVPNIYILDTETPNAFAFGGSPLKSSICITKGLLKLLNRDELQGVVAHEISHIINRDTMYLLYAGVLVNLIGACTNVFLRRGVAKRAGKGSFNIVLLIISIVFIILAPIFAQLFYLCLSRKREFLADACAARYTRYPLALASALDKISSYSYGEDFTSNNLFMKASCITPFDDSRKGGFDLFSTHPSTYKRIKILKSMAGVDFCAYNKAYLNIMGQTIINKGDISRCNQGRM